MVSLDIACIEIRRYLSCANVFLVFDNCIDECLKINLSTRCIRLEGCTAETHIILSEYLELDICNMTNLLIHGNNASFRISIKNIKEDNKKGYTPTNICADPSLQLCANLETVLYCNTCKCDLTKIVKFDRIRKYPSGPINELFCHDSPNFSALITPTVRDIFYDFNYIVLNTNLIQSTTKTIERYLYCNNCSTLIGENLDGGETAKLWADALQMKLNDELIDIFRSSQHSNSFILLRKILHESFTSADAFLQQMHQTKIMIKAAFSNGVRKYILMKLLDKTLRVLRHRKNLALSPQLNNSVLNILLEPCRAFKLLYRLIDKIEPIGEEQFPSKMNELPPLVSYWQEDPSVHVVKVSTILFNNLQTKLEQNGRIHSHVFSDDYDGFQLSYIFYK